MTLTTDMTLVDWLDDLCVRFIINLPSEELQSVERICFQIEEAQWFYEDFIRPLDPRLPTMHLKSFCLAIFKHCPLLSAFSDYHHTQAYQEFLAYKTRVPVRGAIMLNDDMTHAVLVKGWKKSAKWSFPRGKINKDEDDLDCAVREVYEETGYDIQEAGLIGDDRNVKSIELPMREQNMRLYVFRGVPMDTYFEPKTRKEISKIAWYKLTDLPTIKRNRMQEGYGEEGLSHSMFYMVAPFLGPLRGWIKLQRKLDKQRARAGMQPVAPAATGETDFDETEADEGQFTADEGLLPQPEKDDQFADLIANLGRGHRASDALPEVSTQATPVTDPAAELKRLLSVGSGLPLQTPPVEAPSVEANNPLLAMLRGPPSAPSASSAPRTPFDQIVSPPMQPLTPQHHHPRPPQFQHMPPPPPHFFPQQMPFRAPQQPHMPPPYPNGPPMQIPPQFIHQPPPQRNPAFQSHGPSIQQSFNRDAPGAQQPFNQDAPRPYQRTGDPQFAQPSRIPGPHGPAIPAASQLPPPKLTAHSLSLLNAFKSEKPAVPSPPPLAAHQSARATPKMQPPAPLRDIGSFPSPQGMPSATAYAPSPPPFMSPPQNANFQPVQPKPRSAHQDNLLSLFRSPSTIPATPTPPPPKAGAEPVELSAQQTPGIAAINAAQHAAPPKPDLSVKSNLLEAFGGRPRKPSLTSATISGPLNAPDFDTVKKGATGLNGQSRGPSPAAKLGEMPAPVTILKRDGTNVSKISPTDTNQRPISREDSIKSTPTVTPAAFKPKILKRPKQSPTAHVAVQGSAVASDATLNEALKSTGPTHVPSAAQGAFDRRDTLPADQKNVLLGLFSNSQSSKPSTSPAKSPLSSSPLPSALAQSPPAKNPMSGLTSPVSPLPVATGSQADSPANAMSRSRISSLGDTIPPSIQIPQHIPTSNPTSAIKNGLGNGTEVPGLPGLDKGKGKELLDTGATSLPPRKLSEGTSPLDKKFLLGFLEKNLRGL